MKWGVEAQPLIAQTNRIASAMEILGQPLDPKIARALKALRETQGNDAVAKAVQEALDPLCLAAVEVGPTGVTRVIPGRSVPLLVEQGWTLALVKVINQAGTTGILQPDSPSAKPIPVRPRRMWRIVGWGFSPTPASRCLPIFPGWDWNTPWFSFGPKTRRLVPRRSALPSRGQSQVRERGRHGPHWVSGEALLGGDLSCDRV